MGNSVLHNEDSKSEKQIPTPEKSKSIIRLIAKIFGWTFTSLIGLILLILCIISSYLTPERLTPLVEKYAGEFINAKVNADKIELTIWSTFPFVRVDIDNLNIESKSLNNQPDSIISKLPSDHAHLLSLHKMTAGINILRIISGDISLQNIAIDGIDANIVQFNDSISNFNIFQKSEPEEYKESSSIPYIMIDKVELTNSKPIKYFNATTSIDAELGIEQLLIICDDNDSNRLNFTFSGKASYTANSTPPILKMPFNLNGDIFCDQSNLKIKFDNYNINIANIESKLSTDITFGKEMCINSMEYEILPFKIMETTQFIPKSLLPDLSGISSDVSAKLKLNLTSPYFAGQIDLPSIDAIFELPDSNLKYTLQEVGSYELQQLGIKFLAHIDGKNMMASYIEMPKFLLRGEGIDFNITANIKSIFTDPAITLTTKGEIEFDKIAKYIPGIGENKIIGNLENNTSIQCKLSDLTDFKLQNLNITGDAKFNNLIVKLPNEEVDIFNNSSLITFGSDEKSINGDEIIEGMLMLTANIDSLNANVPGMNFSMRQGIIKGATTKDMVIAPTDSNTILPIGISLIAEKLNLLSYADSTKISAKNFKIGGSLKRFANEAKLPLLTAVLQTDKITYLDRLNFISMNELSSSITAHIKKRKPRQTTRYQARYDSIAKANPHLSADSVASLARPKRKSQTYNDNEVISLDVDKGIKDLFRQWDIHGSIQAKQGKLANYSYPTINTISDIDFEFSLDSIILRNIGISSQSNSMRLNGTIRNLRQLMLGRKRQPIIMSLNANIDTVNINEMAKTYEKGLKISEYLAKSGHITLDNVEDIEDVEATMNLNPTDTTRPTALVPRNLDVEIKIRAKKAIYTNLDLYNLGTDLLIKEGALKIDSLKASTGFGQAYLNLLYNTRNPKLLNIGIDLGFERVNIKDFSTSFPQIKDNMPLLTDLNGFVSAKFAGSFDLYENMDINFNSLNAILDIRGNDMYLHQNPTIRKIAKMLFIRNKNDLQINDMIIQAAIHDNILELYPFVFEMDRYKLAFFGESDFAKNMYYHISVLKSPIPFKFGINIKGTFDNPKLRFGGAKYKEDTAISFNNIIGDKRINLITEMKRCFDKLVHKAAMTDVEGLGLGLLKNKTDDGNKEISSDLDNNKSLEIIQNNFVELPIDLILQNKHILKSNTDNFNN